MLRNRQRGLTVLEVLLATFLIFLLTVSFLTIQQRKIAFKPIQECTEKKWQWMHMADEVEWRLRRWEIMASPCLKAGFQPVSLETRTGFPKSWHIEGVSPVVKKVTHPNQYPVPVGHTFSVGQEVIICTERVIHRGTINEVALGQGRQSLVMVTPTDDVPSIMPPPGSLIVAVRPIVYETEAAGTHQILYEKRSTLERKPLGAGFEEWSLTSVFDKSAQSTLVSLEMHAGDCELARNYILYGHAGMVRPGQWWIREGELFFEPWIIQKGALSR